MHFYTVSIEGKKHLFRQYEIFNRDTFLSFLKIIHSKFPKCYLFMDKASPHYRSKEVTKVFWRKQGYTNSCISSNYIKSPEFMVIEEIWNIAKRDLFILRYYPSYADLKNKISQYFRTKKIYSNMRNYLLRDLR